MDHVRYTPLMKQYLDKVLPLAERLQREDITKSRRQLDAEAELMMEYMTIILLINKYDDGESLGAMLRRRIAGLFTDLRKKVWRSGAPRPI